MSWASSRERPLAGPMIVLVSYVCSSHGLSDAPEATMQPVKYVWVDKSIYTVDAAPQALGFGHMIFFYVELLIMIS